MLELTMKTALKKICLFAVILTGLSILFLTLSGTVLGYGEAKHESPSNAAKTAEVCDALAPGKPWLYKAKSIGKGVVELYWDKVDRATSWTVAYGPKSGKHPWGIVNFGNSESRSVKITHLPNGTFYFVVRANNNCMPGPFSNEQKVRLGSIITNIVQQITGKQPTPGAQVTLPPQPTRVPTVKVSPPKNGTQAPTLTPTPKKGGFWQSITDFFSGK